MTSSRWVRSARYLAKVGAITGMDMRKLRHDPTELLTRAIQPLLWLLVFGQVFARAHAIPTGGVDYMAFLGVVALVLLGAALFSTFSLIVACIVKTRERFTGIGQVLTMPLFFASNAIYPTEIKPPWLKVIAHVNPLTFVVDGLRSLMLGGAVVTLGLWLDFTVLVLGLAVLVWAGGRMYPRLIT